jgi:hypothetical protein
MISLSCARTSRTFLMAFEWMKCSAHHCPEYPFVFHCWYTFRKVRWSDSGTWNFSRALSESSSRPLGLGKDRGIYRLIYMLYFETWV